MTSNKESAVTRRISPYPLSVRPEVAAEMTGVTRQAIYIALSSGELPGFKIGRRRLILVEELEGWVRRKAQEH